MVRESVNWEEILGDTYPLVFDQMECGSCYAAASIAAMEIEYARTRHRRINLSVQNVIDQVGLLPPDAPELQGARFRSEFIMGYRGCSGGEVGAALAFQRKGVALAQHYKYIGADQRSSRRLQKIPHVVKIQSYHREYCGSGLPDESESPMTEEKLLELVDEKPVIVSSWCTNTFSSYGGGFTSNVMKPFQDKFLVECDADGKLKGELHSTLVVGYGTTPRGKKFWRVRNSHGGDLGGKTLKGHMLLDRKRTDSFISIFQIGDVVDV